MTAPFPSWSYDDITAYGRMQYIDYYLRSAVLAFAVAVPVGSLAKSLFSRRRDAESKKFNQVDALPDEAVSLLEESPPNADYTGLKEKHFSIENLDLFALDTSSPATSPPATRSPATVSTVRRTAAEKLKVAFEFVLAALQVGIHIGVYRKLSANPRARRPSCVGLLLWVLLLGLVFLRLLNLNRRVCWINRLGNLWMASFVAYLFLFLSSVLPIRSVYLGHIKTPVEKTYRVSQFVVDAVLLLLLSTDRIRNTFPIVYQAGTGIQPSPEPTASALSQITFSWFDRFVWNSHYNGVRVDDIWDVEIGDRAIPIVKSFKSYTSGENTASFSRSLFQFYWRYFFLQNTFALFSSLATFAPVLMIQVILEYVDDQSSTPASLVWLYVVVLFFFKLIAAVTQSQALFIGRRVCARMRTVVISEVFTKALKGRVTPLSKLGAASADIAAANEVGNVQSNADGSADSSADSIGTVINLMAVDAFNVSEICASLHTLVEAVVVTIVAICFLYRLFGWSAIVGLLTIGALLPLNIKLAFLMGSYQAEALGFTDKRTHKMHEVFQAIKVVKLFSWERLFEKRIGTVREQELDAFRKKSAAWVAAHFVWFITPSIVTTVTFFLYIYVQKQTLTVPMIFTGLSLFTILRTPMDQISKTLSSVVQSKVSLDRVQKFLDRDETEKYEVLTICRNRVGFENATLGWNRDESSEFRLKGLNIDFRVGELNVVVGPTGSGKTALLLGLLGELDLLDGKVYVPSLTPRDELETEHDGLTNSVAYCSQNPWLLNSTIKQNIVFNERYDTARYNKVIEACGLTRDFGIMDAGDQTEIGEKGVNLSGGQKQRISLARALYSSSRHVLLDDCLSAVDSHTAVWIYEKCISGPLMQGRTCILASHNVALTVKNAAWVVVLKQGAVECQGEPRRLVRQGMLGNVVFQKTSLPTCADVAGCTAVEAPPTGQEEEEAPARSEEQRAQLGRIVEEETKVDGATSIKIYKWFTQLMGGWKLVSIFMLLFVINEGISIFQKWWLQTWDPRPIESIEEAVRAGTSSGKHSALYFLFIYLLIGILHSFMTSGQLLVSLLAGIGASRTVFNSTLQTVLRAKPRFFDTTPVGRIMNRFTKDVAVVDQELVPFFEGSLYTLTACLSTLVLIACITPAFLLPAVAIAVVYYLVCTLYMESSRDLKRYESISRSPIHQYFSEALNGMTTIRAFGDERRFLKGILSRIDANNRPFFYLWVSNQWMSFRVNVISALVIFLAAALILLNADSLTSGLAGLSLTYALTFTDSALWLVTLYSSLEISMNSAERLREYLELEQEGGCLPGQVLRAPPPQWPEKGEIKFHNLSVRYAPNLPCVIRNATFTVEPASRVGIVGRTGAGKSTIIMALFRFLSPESGCIEIDGLDITCVDLARLRQSLTIIPQDPTLFSGTLRSNLDPYNEFSDLEVLESLRQANLVSAEEIERRSSSSGSSGNSSGNSSSNSSGNKFLDLDHEVSDGGQNMSQGQRQLVCLARSILHSRKIILFDEATASVDYESDLKIQKAIRRGFSNSTVVTIAHRLSSIADYDKVLVMDAGEVKEYDHPHLLLQNKKGIFYEMCRQTGEFDSLFEQAQKAYCV